VNTGARRFNFGMMGLADGIEFVAISMAIYGIAEVVYNLERKQEASVVSGALGRVWPSLADLRYCAGSILRGTGLGAILGVLPGGGALLASYAGEESRPAAAPIRPRRHQGRGGAGSRLPVLKSLGFLASYGRDPGLDPSDGWPRLVAQRSGDALTVRAKATRALQCGIGN